MCVSVWCACVCGECICVCTAPQCTCTCLFVCFYTVVVAMGEGTTKEIVAHGKLYQWWMVFPHFLTISHHQLHWDVMEILFILCVGAAGMQI